jgi:hypothetical protein
VASGAPNVQHVISELQVKNQKASFFRIEWMLARRTCTHVRASQFSTFVTYLQLGPESALNEEEVNMSTLLIVLLVLFLLGGGGWGYSRRRR